MVLMGDLNVAYGVRDIHNFYDRCEFDELCAAHEGACTRARLSHHTFAHSLIALPLCVRVCISVQM